MTDPDATEAWRLSAACRGMDPAIFFVTREGAKAPPVTSRAYALAKRICGECPVAPECLAYSDALPGVLRAHGIWGGLSPRERGRARPRGQRDRTRQAS